MKKILKDDMQILMQVIFVLLATGNVDFDVLLMVTFF